MTESQVLDFLKKNKMDVACARVTTLAGDVYFDAYVECKKVTGLNYNPVLAYCSKGLFYQILEEKTMIEISERLYKKYFKNPAYINKLIKEHREISQKIEKVWAVYSAKKEVSDKELLKTFLKLSNFFHEHVCYDAIGEDKGKFIEKVLIKNFAKRHKLSENRACQLLNILSHPEVQAIFNLEKIDFLKICLAAAKSKNLKKLTSKNMVSEVRKDKRLSGQINSYIKKYFWKNTDFWQTRKINFESVVKEVSQFTKENTLSQIRAELKGLIDGHKKINIEKEKIRKKIKLSAQDEKDIKFMRITSEWIDDRKYMMMKKFSRFFSLVEEIFNRLNIPYEEASFLTRKEIINIFSGQTKFDPKIIQKRKKNFMVIYQTNQPQKIVYGKEAEEMFKCAKNLSKDSRLKGMVASQGAKTKVIGQIMIVGDPYKDKFNKGDILVTSMTRIEFVPLMRKAKAIITNEGGIASHAAIVSREMNVPCIIGTREATDKLKNGDKVEMNMKTGVIRIIK